jgi:phosphate transport system substrate-binding protein
LKCGWNDFWAKLNSRICILSKFLGVIARKLKVKIMKTSPVLNLFITFATAFAISQHLTVLAQQTPEITGAGASFPAVVYTTWAFGFTKEKGIQVKYQPTGSAAGVQSIMAHEVDFGATDIPISISEETRQGLLQFPTVVGGVVPVVNIPSVGTQTLKLTGVLLSEIFRGSIRNWNDPRIAQVNSGLKLPDLKIALVIREEASGTTDTLANYLSTASSDWENRRGRKLPWSGTAAAVRGNDGVAAYVRDNVGAMGYVSLDRALKYKLASVLIQNKDGKFIAPSEQSFAKAVANSALKDNSRASLVNLPGADTWPIVTATFVLIDAKPKTAASARALQFFYWAMQKGDDAIVGSGFAPLPAATQTRVVQQLAGVVAQDGKPIKLLLNQSTGRIDLAAVN